MLALSAVLLLPLLVRSAAVADDFLRVRQPRAALSVSNRTLLESFASGCPVGWDLCSADTCYPDNAECCSDGNFCPNGEYCVAGGGCCSNGEVCSGAPPPPETIVPPPETIVPPPDPAPTFTPPKESTTKHTTPHITPSPEPTFSSEPTVSLEPTFSPTDTFDPEPTSSFDSGDDPLTDSPSPIVTFSPISSSTPSISATNSLDGSDGSNDGSSPLATGPLSSLNSGAIGTQDKGFGMLVVSLTLSVLIFAA